MAEEVGAAFVSLIPSARGFSRLAQREIKQELRGNSLVVPITPEVQSAAPVRIPAILDPDRTEVIGGTIHVPADVDPGQLRSETTAAIRTVEATRPTVDVGVDVDRGILGRLIGGKTTTIVEQDGRNIGVRLAEAIGGGLTSSAGSSGSGLLSGVSTVTTTIGGLLSTGLAAAVAPLAAGVGFAVASAISAGISSALISGAGLGAIGLGAFILAGQADVQKAWMSLADQARATFGEAAKPLIGPFVESLGILRQLVVDIGPDLRRMFEAIAPAIVPLTRGLAGFAREALPGIVALVGAATPLLQDLESTLPRLGSDIGAFFGLIAAGGPGASQFFRDLLHLLGLTLKAIGVGIVIFTSWYTTTRDVVAGILELGRQAVVGWGANIADLKRFFSGLGSSISGVWDGVKRSTTSLVGFFGTLPRQIKNAVGDLGGLLYQAGRNVVNGLINGIKSMFGALANTASNMAGIIRNYLPFSPAKEGPLSGSGNPFRSGQTIAQMLAGGMESQLPAVSSASSQLAGAVSFGGQSSGTAAAAAPRLEWAPGATGDRLLDAIRELIRVDWGGDPNAALGSV